MCILILRIKHEVKKRNEKEKNGARGGGGCIKHAHQKRRMNWARRTIANDHFPTRVYAYIENLLHEYQDIEFINIY
jgi:hypothetical protein